MAPRSDRSHGRAARRPAGHLTPEPHERFAAAAATYSQRPGYPAAAIDWLLDLAGLSPGAAAIDLGAGTGLLSARLAGRGLSVTAVEPNDAMRAELEANVPGATVLDAKAESLPVPDESFSLATAGQAYHWFDPASTLPEVHRVLRRGGSFAVAWLLPDLRHPIQAKIRELSWKLLSDSDRPGPLPDEPLGWDRHFELQETAEFAFTRSMHGNELPAYVASFSVVAVLEPVERQKLLDEAASWADANAELDLPYRAVIHLGRRRPAPT